MTGDFCCCNCKAMEGNPPRPTLSKHRDPSRRSFTTTNRTTNVPVAATTPSSQYDNILEAIQEQQEKQVPTSAEPKNSGVQAYYLSTTTTTTGNDVVAQSVGYDTPLEASYFDYYSTSTDKQQALQQLV